MASLRELRRRIKSVESIHGITKAMELISAVRYKKISSRFKSAMQYADSIENLISRIVSEDRTKNNPLFEKRNLQKELLVVITGDRGLCGSFNSSILKELKRYLDSNKDREIHVYAVGKVGTNFCKKRDINLYKTWIDVGYEFTADSLKEKTNEIIGAYSNGEFDKVNILSMKMKSTSSYDYSVQPFLDLSFLMELNEDQNIEYIFEPEPQRVFNTLVDLFIEQRFFIALLNSVTAEYLARMLAMKQASDNGKDVIQKLTLKRNKVRQAMITQEIGEIIGGAEALN